MRILVIGANGQLGSDIVKALHSKEVIPLTHKDIEIADEASIKRAMGIHNPQVVISTAAYHKVTDCERNEVKSFEVNAIGAKNLANVCQGKDAVLVYISTDYVFDGEKKTPYLESDRPGPLNTYGISKLAGEYYIRYIWPKHFIIRTSGLYGSAKCRAKGGNFIDLMLRLAQERDEIQVVDDEVLTPTYTKDLALQIRGLIQTDYFGLYHITNNGACSWYGFAQKIFELSHLKVNLKKTTVEKLGTEIKRPRYSVLRNYALQRIGMDNMRRWEEALKAYLVEKKELTL